MTDRRNLVVGLVAGMSGLAALSQAAGAQAAVSEAEAQGAIDSFLEAVFSGDPAKVDQVLAPEFQILRSDGKNDDKVSYLGALPKHKNRPATSEVSSTRTGLSERNTGSPHSSAGAPRWNMGASAGSRRCGVS